MHESKREGDREGGREGEGGRGREGEGGSVYVVTGEQSGTEGQCLLHCVCVCLCVCLCMQFLPRFLSISGCEVLCTELA